MEIKNKALAYILQNDKILVFDHVDFPHVNPQVPGGTVDIGETPEQAASREVLEESGQKLPPPIKCLGVFDHQNSETQLHKRHIFVFNTCDLPDAWEHIVSSGEEDEGLRFKFYWLPINEARENLVSDMGKYLHLIE